MDRIMIFVDESNATGAAQEYGRNLDWEVLRQHILASFSAPRLVEMVVYIGLPPAVPELQDRRSGKERFARKLQQLGFLVVTKDGAPTDPGHYKSNVDALMAIDAMDLSTDIMPDWVVLVTGDGDFAHLAVTLRRKGIKVAACATGRALSAQLENAVNKRIHLEDILAGMEAYQR
ncbi:MAG: NYN domain-containing protein [Deltaproteobacteria bacterium]|nr:NYN domain-containing protein [Candidatus Anaeroferrophillacea bacterium]